MEDGNTGPGLISAEARAALMRAPRPQARSSHRAARRTVPAAACRSRTRRASIDQADRPIYAVWEITLKCDLACRHCGSRAGHARPDELTTAECLDLVRQMAELGVKEVTLIGGEAYLRDDWTRHHPRASQARHAGHDDHRRPRHDGGARRGGGERRACMSASVSIDGVRGDARSPARRARLVRVRARRDREPARGGRRRSR